MWPTRWSRSFDAALEEHIRSLSVFARQTTTGGLGEAQTRWIARAAQSSSPLPGRVRTRVLGRLEPLALRSAPR
jgi:hypothetical protein